VVLLVPRLMRLTTLLLQLMLLLQLWLLQLLLALLLLYPTQRCRRGRCKGGG
jgi:hypothetical protein